MTAPYLPPVTCDAIVDLSHYDNVSQDFVQTAEAGIVAVILKATQGIEFVDKTFLPRVAEARAAGLLVGAYHFLTGDNPAAQAAHFLTVAMSEGGVNWLALDWEQNTASQASAMQAATASASIQTATGRWPVIYMGRYMLSAPNKTLLNSELWLPEYGTRPICPPGFASWQLWQFSSSVATPGIGSCDRSKFAGTVDQLKAWWKNQSIARP